MTKISAVLKVVDIYPHAKFQAIHSMCSAENAQDPNFDQFHPVKIVPRLGKSTGHGQNLMDYGGGHQHEMAYPFPNQKLHS